MSTGRMKSPRSIWLKLGREPVSKNENNFPTMACKHFEGAQNGKLNNGRNFNDNAEKDVQLECLSYLQNNNNITFCLERFQKMCRLRGVLNRKLFGSFLLLKK